MTRLVLVRSGGLIPALIQAVTWSRWNHAALELDDGRQLAADSSRGVQIYAPDPESEIARFQVKGLNLDDAAAAARAQLGKPYDWSAVIGIGLHRDWTEPDSWFCSELVAWACRAAGVDLLRFDRLNRVSPGQLALSPLLIPA